MFRPIKWSSSGPSHRVTNSCQILMKPEFCDRISKNPQISNFTKVRPMGAEVLHADGWRNMTPLTVPVRNFANTPKKAHILVQCFLFLCPLLNTITCSMFLYSQNYLTILPTSFYVLQHLSICQYILLFLHICTQSCQNLRHL